MKGCWVCQKFKCAIYHHSSDKIKSTATIIKEKDLTILLFVTDMEEFHYIFLASKFDSRKEISSSESAEESDENSFLLTYEKVQKEHETRISNASFIHGFTEYFEATNDGWKKYVFFKIVSNTDLML